MHRTHYLVLALFVAWIGAFAACDDDEDTKPDDAEDIEDMDDTDDIVGEDIEDDAETSPWILDLNHEGWADAQCLDCHTRDEHNEGLLPYECVDCHGTNGASDGHTFNVPCSRCHGTPHGGQDLYPDPVSCQTCHPR